MKRVRELARQERPREKLLLKGPKALSDLELLAVLLGSGNKEHDVMALANQILKVLDGESDSLDISNLQKIDGVGPAKAALVAAAMEFARRRIRPEGMKISFPSDVLPLLAYIADRKQEHFICISLNGANEVIASRVVSVGLLNRTQVHPREVFADPITDRAAAIIVAHNHPSGNTIPSKDDYEITRQLKKAGDVLGIHLMDHIVFGSKGYYSLLEHSEL